MNKRRNKILILLLAGSVVLIFGGLVLWKTQPWLPNNPGESLEPIKFTPMVADPGQIMEIEFLFNQNTEKINLIRDDLKGWVLADQPDKALPKDHMDLALNLLMNLSAVSDVPVGTQDEQLGLDPPIAKVVLTMTGDVKQVLDIGKLDHASGLYYVRMNDGNPFMTDFDTVYSILKIFYLKVLPVSLTKESVPTPVITLSP